MVETMIESLLQAYNINSGNPTGIYLLTKDNKRNTRTRCDICSKLTIKTPARLHWRRSGVFTVNFEYFSHLVLVFLLLTLSWQMPDSHVILKQTQQEQYHKKGFPYKTLRHPKRNPRSEKFLENDYLADFLT